jgi:hypothetical protein
MEGFEERLFVSRYPLDIHLQRLRITKKVLRIADSLQRF